jgi:hypothetical protein
MVAMFCSCAALADSNTPVVDQAVIGSAGQNYQGNFSVNQAAGDQQQQINGRAIAIGTTEAQATGQYRQQLNTRIDPLRNARSAIEGSAFSNGSGILGVNQSSGANNQQINAKHRRQRPVTAKRGAVARLRHNRALPRQPPGRYQRSGLHR